MSPALFCGCGPRPCPVPRISDITRIICLNFTNVKRGAAKGAFIEKRNVIYCLTEKRDYRPYSDREASAMKDIILFSSSY